MKAIKIASIYLQLLIITFLPVVVSGQMIRGGVFEYNTGGEKTPLASANVYWAGTFSGTVTSDDGSFELLRNPGNIKLVAGYTGYVNDTVHVSDPAGFIEIILHDHPTLEEVVVSAKQKSTFVSQIEPLHVETITGFELQRAACCNLSESFETNASVDVSYSDAITGAKKIQLLGLHGKYSRMMAENIPNMRGLSSTFGLEYIPGSWMESIQISKGASSVVNGYESITGLINVEYKKPDHSEKLFFNAYLNSLGKMEANMNSARQISDRWSTALFLHAEDFSNKIDHNGDSFLDHPVMRQYNVSNRWKYLHKNVEAQMGINLIDEMRTGGQAAFNRSEGIEDQSFYGIHIDTRRYEAWSKFGYVFPNKPNTSIGFLNSFTYFDQHAFFGRRTYTGLESSYYANLILQSELGSEHHGYSAGISFLYDDISESLSDSSFTNLERVPGAFFQYTYQNNRNLTIILGLRADHHNQYGLFYTPRFHSKYNLSPSLILRASAGKGYRTAHVISENSYLLASSKRITLLEEARQEEAWNVGLNVSKHFDLAGREFTASVEFYRTDFINQLIIDRDRAFDNIHIYNLSGKSFSNSIQAEVSGELIPQLDFSMAFRITDVKMTIDEKLDREPLVSRYKGLLSFSYKTADPVWQFDLTGQLNGPSRIPSTEFLPGHLRQPAHSPEYVVIHTQISRFFEKWSLYIGLENLTGYVQKHPIIASDDPFGPYFDSSMIWGPLSGRKVYAGFRFIIE